MDLRLAKTVQYSAEVAARRWLAKGEGADVLDGPGWREAARRHCERLPMVPQSSSASRLTAGAAGFLTLIQSFDRPGRYCEPRRLDTMPSQPSLRAWWKTMLPSTSKCRLKATPGCAL
jgi:hypothetical protein